MASSCKYKLIYWNVRAKAEPIRWMFAYGGVPFEDYRIHELPSYVSPAPNPEWTALKGEVPYGTVPVLLLDGNYLGESHAIGRYLAKECGLAGTNDWEAAQADSILTYLGAEFDSAMDTFMREMDQEKKKAAKETTMQKIAKVSETLEKILRNNKSSEERKFLVGSTPTFVDFFVVSFGDVAEAFVQPGVMGPYKLLATHKDLIRGLPGVEKFIQDHAHLAMSNRGSPLYWPDLK